MTQFLRFFRTHLRDTSLLVWALVFAFLSAFSLGAGLMGMIPILKSIFDPKVAGEDQGLQAWAVRFNASDPVLAIPQWFVTRLPTDQWDGVVLIVIGLAILTFFGAMFNFLHQYFSITLAARTIARVRASAFEHVLRMPLSLVSYEGPSHFVARIIRDTAALQRGIISLTGKAVANVTKGVIAFIVAIILGGKLTLLAVLVAPVVVVVLRKLGKRIRRGTRGALRGQEELLRLATEALQGLRSVKANTGENLAIQRFEVQNKQVVKQELRARTARALSGPLMELIAIVSLGALAIYAAKEIIDGKLSVDLFLAALGALAVTGVSFKPLAAIINELQAASAPAQRLGEILGYQVEEEKDAPMLPDLPRHEKSVAFEQVWLTYRGKEEPALCDVSLTIEYGQRIAIVGPNGSGKTTLLSLIPRLLVPDRGIVSIDGADLAGFNLRSIRTQVGVVTQETVLFRGSIEENIAYGIVDCSHDRIVDAARHARAHEFILNLPGQYKADVLELGASLSGGQRQRLAIARALLRNPTILILDEATSQIDAESEARINEAIADISKSRTVILIAHRLATVIDADRIVVMDEGRITDQGRHDELLERCELYRRLIQNQLIASV